MTQEIRDTLRILPQGPGCYQFLDEMKKRVSSYFNKHQENPKTRILVRNIRQIKYIVVNTEEDTFLLENNLIKELKPRYNVMLKDDKSYPSIVIKNEFFPRVFKTRNIVKDGSKYFGPYTSVAAVDTLIEVFRKIYKVRTCRLNLTPENISAGKFKVCLEYHIKRCDAPCVGYQSLENYNKNIAEITEILKGNISLIEKQITIEMQHYSDELRFEEAQRLKEKLLLIRNFREKSQVISNVHYNLDVYGFAEDENTAYINYLHVVNGGIIQAYTFEYKKKLDETPEELLGLGIVEMRQRFGSESKEIIVPFIPDLILSGVEFIVPGPFREERQAV